MTTGIEGEAMSEPKDIEQLVEFRDKLLEWRNKAIWAWAVNNMKFINQKNFNPKEGHISIPDLKDFLEVGKESACQEP